MKVHNTTVLALLTFLILSNLAGQADAQAHYNCGSVSANHCYGVAAWSQGGEFFGTYADITITAMDGGDGFLDNEMWLVDNQSSGCKANSYGRCWEEVGYINQNNGTSGEVYFWADARPRNDSTFNVHILGTTNPFETTPVHFMVIKDGRVSPQIYQIYIYDDSHSTFFNGQSQGVSNPMVGTNITIGQELAGSSGAGSGGAEFPRNIWAVQPLGPEFVFWYQPQTIAGFVTSHSPPFARWVVVPGDPSNSTEGGIFTTVCCQ